MFRKIFFFEIQNRVRRPAVYLYFAAALIFTIGTFATGSLPLADKEHINAPIILALWSAGITMMLMIVSSSIMGTALYKDIEYNTKDYYLTYPITKAGYFWGRYLGSFFIMLCIASAVMIGAYIGTLLGPAMGWKDAAQYGPNKFIYYLHPFLTLALPNLFFTSSLFFGLVAITRNVKVIYSGGILLFLGYFLSMFFLSHTNNETVIDLADPFGLNGVRMQMNNSNSVMQNTTLMPVQGSFLLNRILWPGIGLLVILFTYVTFSFRKFFSGKRDKAIVPSATSDHKSLRPSVQTKFGKRYNRTTLGKLTKIELTNIVRDNYFWIILLSGIIFLGFIFWMGNGSNGVSDLPRTVMLLNIFNSSFLFFAFFVIVFYTGETLHRDRVTRFAFINDALPMPNWVLNGSKLLSILVLAFALAWIPFILGIPVQLIKGFHLLHVGVYLLYISTLILPRLLEMAAFAYMVHVVINHKFAAHAVAIIFWVALFFLDDSGLFSYKLLTYSYTPGYDVSDMNGMGHMAIPVQWFNLYWMLCGSLLLVLSALFYYRGVTAGFRDRWHLVAQRFDRRTKLISVAGGVAFLVVGGYIYYNISYLNAYLTGSEMSQRAVLYEKQLKRFEKMPLPKVIHMVLQIDLFPDHQEQRTHGLVTMVNLTNQPIRQLLLDADGLEYSVKQDGRFIPFDNPLVFPRGKFNFLRPKLDTSDFRLFTLNHALMPGDSTVLDIHSKMHFTGFRNDLFAKQYLYNGTFAGPGLPGLGYDADEEESSPYVRKQNHLPLKVTEDLKQDDSSGISTLAAGKSADLLNLEITVSTAGDQTALAPGVLVRQWKQGGRKYFHYIQHALYAPIGILSARYAVMHDTIQLDRLVNIDIYYHPEHKTNLGRFMAAYKNGLRSLAAAYGPYPFHDIRLAESSTYGPREADIATLVAFNEDFAWQADFTDPNQNDYCYNAAIRHLANQWWRFQVSHNNTVGSMMVSEGLGGYSSLLMQEKKYGASNMRPILLDQLWFYLFIRRRLEEREHPLITADQWYEWGGKAAVALYGLRDLMGEDSLHAALRDFGQAYAFKTKPPFAGSADLFRYLHKHVPDSLQYYLTDTWQRITLYDSKVTDVQYKQLGKNNYIITMQVDVEKVWIDSSGNDIPVRDMNDYIDIGAFAADTKNAAGRTIVNPLYLHKYKLSSGLHTIRFAVSEKPQRVGIDPYNKLVDRQPNDNLKNL